MQHEWSRIVRTHQNLNPPEGFKNVASAPKDGTFIRLRFRPGLGREAWEVVAKWAKHDDMPAGGWWFDRDGCYVTPGPLYWAPEQGGIQ